MRRRWSKALLAAVLVLALPPASGEASSTLVLAYGVTRHGARNALPKTANLSEPAAGVTLLPLGQRQCYNAGAAFRARYLDGTNCTALRGVPGEADSTCMAPPALAAAGGLYGLVNAPSTTFSNYNVRVVSSALDRTLLSAHAFLSGAFPAGAYTPTASAFLPDGAQPVPVYAAAGADADDTLVRAYTKCPSYVAQVTAWYGSNEFAAAAAASAPLRAAVAALPGWPAGVSNDTSLVNIYNIFDAFSVSRNGYGDPMPAVNATMWASMVNLTNWLESRKASPDLGGALPGAPLLADLTARLSAATSALAARPDPSAAIASYVRLALVFAHYNSQLALLAALGVAFNRMPATASVLVFELHRSAANASSYAVRAVLQDGPAAAYAPLPLPCATPAAAALAGSGACTLEAFLATAAPAVAAAGTAAAWCSACGATVPAPCVVAAAAAAAVAPPAPPSPRARAKRHLSAKTVALVVGVIVGVGLPVASLLLFLVWRRRRLRARRASAGGAGGALPDSAVWPHQPMSELGEQGDAGRRSPA